MRVKIPQDVEREDRIIGPLTVRQFLYSLATAALVYVVYQSWLNFFLPTAVFFILEILILVMGALLVFWKFNGKDFVGFLFIALKYLKTPKTMLWQKDNEFLRDKIQISQKEIKQLRAQNLAQQKKEAEHKSRLEKLSTILHLGGKMGSSDEDLSSSHTISHTNIESPLAEEAGLEDVLAENEDA